MMCSKYMRYGEEIDEYLQNRPHPLIRHCLLKKNLGENLDLTGICVTGTGKLSIIYYKDGQWGLYNVDFGSDETMPSCSCPDWEMSAHPCKHFFAIFKKYASWDWNPLSKLYKNSPYLTLDENVTDSTEFEAQPVNKNENDEIAHRENETITQTSYTVTLEELPSKKMKVKNRVNGDTCRSLLNDVKSLSFLNENDQEKLNRVFSVLQNLKEEIECDLPKEKSIPLMPKKLPNSSSVRRSKKQLGQTPLPKRKTSKLKRVGKARERFIGSTDLKITEEKKCVENENAIVEHLVDENVNYDSVSSFNVDITVSITNSRKISPRKPQE